MSRPRSPVILTAVVLLLSLRPSAQTPVPAERLLNATKEPQNWMMYGGDYSSNRYSSLTQITPLNAKSLAYAWAYQSPNTGSWEATPLVVDGIMFLTQRPNDVVALDAATGRVFWMYRYNNSTDIGVCCGSNNRGLAILGDTPAIGEVVPGYGLDPWLGLFMPAKVPQDVVAKVHGEVVKILGAPELKARLGAQGIELVTSTPSEFSRFIRAGRKLALDANPRLAALLPADVEFLQGDAGDLSMLAYASIDVCFVSNLFEHLPDHAAMDRVLQITVPITVKGEAPGVKQQGGILEYVHRSIEVECLPANIPESIEINVGELMLQNLRVPAISVDHGCETAVLDVVGVGGREILEEGERLVKVP